MNMDAVTRALAFVMFVGAAREDASPDQRHRLGVVVPPLLKAYKAGEVEEETIRRAVRKIMGREWRPSARWREGFWGDAIDGQA